MKVPEKGFSFKEKKKVLEMAANTSMAEILLMSKIIEEFLKEYDIFYLNNHPDIVWNRFVKVRDGLIKEMKLLKQGRKDVG